MPGEKPPQPKPEWLDSAKQPEAEQRWREAIYELSNENWPLFTEMVRLQAQGKFRELFAAVDKTPLPPVETDEAEGIVAMPAAAHELINNATKKDHDLAAAFEKISKEVKGYPRLKFLITCSIQTRQIGRKFWGKWNEVRNLIVRSILLNY